MSSPDKALGYDPSDPASILRYAQRIDGLSVRSVERLAPLRAPGTSASAPRSKGTLGHIVEEYFGIRRNNRPEPDFPIAGVELKVVPLKHTGGRIRAKEPTSISMIDYMTLPSESWETTASVRKKLNLVLFVFVEIHPVLQDSEVRGIVLWRPTERDDTTFREDWERTRAAVAAGRAHELSERQSAVLAARRKGAGGPDEPLRSQPGSRVPAKSRAWALKVAFTTQLFDEVVLGAGFESALAGPPGFGPRTRLATAEERAVASLRAHTGATLGSLVSELDLGPGSRKDQAARIIKRLLGFQRVSSRIKEFDQLGTIVKTIHARPTDHHVFESVSFPAVKLADIPGQDWEGVEAEDGCVVKERSDLIDQVERILFVPTYSMKPNDPQVDRTLGVPFVWTPSREDWETIAAEWRMFQAEIAAGKAEYDRPPGSPGRKNRLTPASLTQRIHVRPHGRDSWDEDLDPLGNWVTKQCFWLNSRFIEGLLRDTAANGGGNRTPR